ncbi:MAG: bacillithiol biosynthesis cysteine-adding enzyme BshC [Flavobacteriaceae bacterium]
MKISCSSLKSTSLDYYERYGLSLNSLSFLAMARYAFGADESFKINPLLKDYLTGQLPQQWYNRFADLENVKAQIDEKSSSYNHNFRAVLHDEIKRSYDTLAIDLQESVVLQHMELLKEKNTFTITTGHQLNLFTGPVFFVYKILHTIVLCEKFKSEYPDFNFIPVYWMASEDHDFEEINHFQFKGKKFQWNSAQKGAVGQFDLHGLDEVFKVFKSHLGRSKNDTELKSLFESAYLKFDNLAQAAHLLVHELFERHGLIVLDADKRALKDLMIPLFKQELISNPSHTLVKDRSEKMGEKGYKAQVFPRPINLFHLSEQERQRIDIDSDSYQLVNSKTNFSQEEILSEVEAYPERFSPNVILRPLYQEYILPNLMYVGGAGELSYWFQLKSVFEHFQVVFPMLKLRHSVYAADEKTYRKLQKLNVVDGDLNNAKNQLINRWVRKVSNIPLELTDFKALLDEQFNLLQERSKNTDRSFEGAVQAQRQKQMNGLDKLEKRLLLAQKRVLKDEIQRISVLYELFYPLGKPQERVENFSTFYSDYGSRFMEIVYTEFQKQTDSAVLFIEL